MSEISVVTTEDYTLYQLHTEALSASVMLGKGKSLGGIKVLKECGVKDLADYFLVSKYRNAIAGLPYGGAAVIIKDSETLNMNKFGDFLNEIRTTFNEEFLLFEDFGLTSEGVESGSLVSDSIYFGSRTTLASSSTAWSVLSCLKAIRNFKELPKDVYLNIDGVGKVGKFLAGIAKVSGFKVCVSDKDKTKAFDLAEEKGYAWAAQKDIRFLEGIYCPCGVDRTVDQTFAMETDAFAVCGAVDIPLSNSEVGTLLSSRGLLYVPAFVANSGSAIQAAVCLEAEHHGMNNPEVAERVTFVSSQASAILLASTTTAESAEKIGITAAKAVIQKGLT